MRTLIKQAKFLPVYFFIPAFTAGFLVEGYSAISQHGSEITLTENSTAKAILNTGAIATGVSCILLACGLIMAKSRELLLSSLLIILFGVSMISNGLYPMGSPMHGIYGMGLTLMILPFIACFELKGSSISLRYFPVSIVSGLVIFVYLWSMLVGLDPAAYRGLTQRLASVIIFGWLAYTAYEIDRSSKHEPV